MSNEHTKDVISSDVATEIGRALFAALGEEVLYDNATHPEQKTTCNDTEVRAECENIARIGLDILRAGVGGKAGVTQK